MTVPAGHYFRHSTKRFAGGSRRLTLCERRNYRCYAVIEPGRGHSLGRELLQLAESQASSTRTLRCGNRRLGAMSTRLPGEESHHVFETSGFHQNWIGWRRGGLARWMLQEKISCAPCPWPVPARRYRAGAGRPIG